MPANPIDIRRLKFCSSHNIDGVRPRRHSTDPARRAWYAQRRQARLARRLLG